MVVRDHRTVSYDEGWTDSRDNRFDNHSRYEGREIPRIAAVGGEYSSTYGVVTLNQVGTRITGYYPSHNGTIDGVVDGNVIRFHWKQPDGEGTGVWYLGANNSMSGSFGFGPNATNGGAWTLNVR